MVIPTYNRRHLLRRAIRSALAQSVSGLEIVVIDDGSTDGTDSMIVTEFPSVNYVRMPQRSGAGVARNEGVRQAKGDWIAFLDSDDIWLPDKIERQMAVAYENPEAELLCCGVKVNDRRGAIHLFCQPDGQPSGGWSMAEFQHYAFMTPTWFIRKASFERIQGFDGELENSEDLDFLARFLKAGGQIRMIEAIGVEKFNQADSLDADLGKLERSYGILLERHGDLWRQSPEALGDVWLRLANMRLAKGDFRSGITALKQCVAVCPGRVNVRFWVGVSVFGPTVFNWVRGMRYRLLRRRAARNGDVE